MFAGSSKPGRGAGRGGGGGGPRRFSAPPPPLQPTRPALPPSSSRPSLSGGPRHRKSAPSPAAPPAVEETFSLVSGNNPLAFGMIIKLTPDLVEEIRRLEAQGETAKIKFNANPKNPSGNLINVGGKEFRFTWSKECGDLCDIYEEKQSGEDGNGLLVESGCAWRKLNVQRILDESTTNHVKMLSEEAERKNKARKAIVLEHGNPSMKNQLKQFAAVEATSTWRMGFKKKEPPPKKRKVDPPNVSSSGFKSAYNPGLSSNPKASGKGVRAVSPVISTPDPFRASASPTAAVNISKGNTTTEDAEPAVQMSKEDRTTLGRETPAKFSGVVSEWSGNKANSSSQPMDLQNMLVSLLRDNPKGMSIKALEKAIGYMIPSSGKNILSKIATYQGPGRYFLKPGVELEGFKGASPGSGSSFEDGLNQVPTFEENFNRTTAPEPMFSMDEVTCNGLDHAGSAAEVDLYNSENVDIERTSPYLSGDKKKFDNSGGHADRSSDSGRDSDSSSSDSQSRSGSPSRSRSRSKSPVASGSVRSSESERGSSSNQEGPDKDVDIMTSDDDKRPKNNFQESAPTILASTPDGGFVDIDGVDEKNDGHESDIVDIDTVEEGGYEHGATDAEKHLVYPGQDTLRERQNLIGSLFDEEEAASEDKSDSSERTSRGKTTKGYDSAHSDAKTERVKRAKTGKFPKPAVPQGDLRPYSLSPYDSSPNRHNGDYTRNTANRDVNAQFSMHKGSQTVHENRSLHSQSSHREYNQGFSGSVVFNASGKLNKQAENLSDGHLPTQKDRSVREARSEAYNLSERGMRSDKERSSKHFQPFDSPRDKLGETVNNSLKVVGQTSSVQIGSCRKDIDGAGAERPSLVNGRGGAMPQKELSGLEIGELPLEDAPVKRPSERKLMKQSINKSNSFESQSKDRGKGKTPGKLSIESGKPLTPNLSRKRTVERREDEPAMPLLQGVQSQPQYPSKGDHADGTAQTSKKVNTSKLARNGPLKLDSARGAMKESKTQPGNITANLSNGQKEVVSADYGGGLRRRESSSDKNSCSYSKFEKEEPELKGKIKDLPQFEEYVQEYRDKYENYCSINKILESYRNKFQKMGKELELAKGRDMGRYNQAVEQLRDSYRKCGSKHKRLKKIFIILHQELKHLKQMINDFAQSKSKD